MELAKFETKVDVVLSDVYIGLHMMMRYQLEQRESAIESAVKENNFIRHLVQPKLQTKETEDEDPFASDPRKMMHKKASIFILQQQNENSTYQVCERNLLLQSNEEDRALMRDLAYYSRYALIIYSELRTLAVEDFGLKEDKQHFTRGLDAQFDSRYRLSSLDYEHTMLSFVSFLNGMVSTPYAILVDNSEEKVVITIRGSVSIEDLVVDMQYKPTSLEKVGVICGSGSDLRGHYCHKGESNWPNIVPLPYLNLHSRGWAFVFSKECLRVQNGFTTRYDQKRY